MREGPDLRAGPPPTAIATAAAVATAVAPRKRNRPYALFAGAGVLAAVVAAGVLATGLLSSAAEQPGRGHALPLAPTPAPADPTKPVPPSAKSPSRSSAAPSTKPRVAMPPPSPTRSSEPPSSSPPPSTPPPTARATGSVRTTPPPRREPTDRPLLAEGDEGPEVAELQKRLAQLSLYAGEPDGAYTRQVSDAVAHYQWARGLTDDPRGEYGRETRRSLEAETEDP
ncbi:peptidoglycan-binding domain-containing protein [Streptomyces sp. DSM 118878]